jgi:DNA-binding transcriptional LysR family regulator
LPDARFQTYPLTEDQFVALVPAQSPFAARSNIRLDELCDDAFIMPESGSAQIISRLFVNADLHPNVRYRTSQVLSTMTMVARGQGVSVVADLALPPSTGTEGWVRVPLNPVRTRTIGLAMHKNAVASPAAMAFVKTAEKLRKQTKLL